MQAEANARCENENSRHWLRVRLLFGVLAVVASLLLIDWPGRWFDQPTVTFSVPVLARDDPARDFLLKQYENAVAEIQMRLAQENLMFALKFSLIGAILALLFGAF